MEKIDRIIGKKVFDVKSCSFEKENVWSTIFIKNKNVVAFEHTRERLEMRDRRAKERRTGEREIIFIDPLTFIPCYSYLFLLCASTHRNYFFFIRLRDGCYVTLTCRYRKRRWRRRRRRRRGRKKGVENWEGEISIFQIKQNFQMLIFTRNDKFEICHLQRWDLKYRTWKRIDQIH